MKCETCLFYKPFIFGREYNKGKCFLAYPHVRFVKDTDECISWGLAEPQEIEPCECMDCSIAGEPTH